MKDPKVKMDASVKALLFDRVLSKNTKAPSLNELSKLNAKVKLNRKRSEIRAFSERVARQRTPVTRQMVLIREVMCSGCEKHYSYPLGLYDFREIAGQKRYKNWHETNVRDLSVPCDVEKEQHTVPYCQHCVESEAETESDDPEGEPRGQYRVLMLPFKVLDATLPESGQWAQIYNLGPVRMVDEKARTDSNRASAAG